VSWVYLAPHLDDVSFSCGGLVWEQSQRGEKVEIWTICAGDPPDGPLASFAQSLHESWGTGLQTPAQRREEDRQASAQIGATSRFFEFPDCIYRRDAAGEPLYNSSAAVFGAVHPSEQQSLVSTMAERIRAELPQDATLVSPIGLGNHVDHQLVRAAVDQLGLPHLYYADYPYVLKAEHLIGYLLPQGSKGELHPISEEGLAAWQRSVACYKSQLSTYWPEPGSLETAFSDYWGKLKGIHLWRAA
jgi:LmbE family N-acetylglucosaminyl deacetylase